MKVIYPNNLSRKKFIKTLMNKYFFCEKEWFAPQQIESPINVVVNALENEIEKCGDKSDFEICVVAKCKAIFDFSINDALNFSENFKAIFYYFHKEPENIKADLRDEEIDYPTKNSEQYLTFISAMTREVIEEIIHCNNRATAVPADVPSHKRSRTNGFFQPRFPKNPNRQFLKLS
jgi:hypothetical protein